MKQEEDFIRAQRPLDMLFNIRQNYLYLQSILNRRPQAVGVAVFYAGGKKGAIATVKQLTGCTLPFV